jgi:hypothetical protein
MLQYDQRCDRGLLAAPASPGALQPSLVDYPRLPLSSGSPSSTATTSAWSTLSTNPMQHQRTKHVEINLHFVCD